MQNITDITIDEILKPSMIKLEDDVKPKIVLETVNGQTIDDSSVVVKQEIEVEETTLLHNIKSEILENEDTVKQEEDCSVESDQKGMGLRVCSFAKENDNLQNLGQPPSLSKEPIGPNLFNQNAAQGTCLVLPNIMLAPNNFYYVGAPNSLPQLVFTLGMIPSLAVPLVQMPTVDLGVNTVEPNVQENNLINEPKCQKTVTVQNKPKQVPQHRKIRPKSGKNQTGELRVEFETAAKIEKASDSVPVEIDSSDVEVDLIIDEIKDSESHPKCRSPKLGPKSNAKFRCDICWFETKYKWVFDTHASEHTTFKTAKESALVQYKCPKCPNYPKMFKTLIEVFFHVKKRHKSAQLCRCRVSLAKRSSHVCKRLSSKMVMQMSHRGCRFCRRTVKNGLKRHILLMHKYMKLYLCGRCSFDTPDELLFLRHKVRHELKLPMKSKSRHRCPVCEKQMRNRDAFNRHVIACKSCKYIDYYRCTKCSFYSNSRLKLHFHLVNEHFQDRVLTCKICMFKTRSIRILSRHVLTHFSREQMVKCDRCFFQTEHPKLLKFHSTNHGECDPKLAVCKVCPYRARNSAELKEHVKEKHFFRCKSCSWSTNSCKLFRRHRCQSKNMQMPKRYRCNCRFITTSKRVFHKHVRHHKRAAHWKWLTRWSFHCRLCSFVTSCRFNFYEHISGHVLDKAHSCHLCKYKIVKLMNA
ncbi:zinc finger Y-chromosomal protein-like [Cylas formicarius]|uniref:zinc finger Y-chromosomal protein-like n=1 Tax=Cylas formicarius TaxID=197179 RepID=UPI002958839B|nr:zinc finger Y-chromosomal protein-like [Cylas formicarius]